MNVSSPSVNNSSYKYHLPQKAQSIQTSAEHQDSSRILSLVPGEQRKDTQAVFKKYGACYMMKSVYHWLATIRFYQNNFHFFNFFNLVEKIKKKKKGHLS